jgi:hypothetical protein
MAFHTLALEYKAVDVALSESGSRLAVLSNTDLALYALDLNKRPIPKPTLLWKLLLVTTDCFVSLITGMRRKAAFGNLEAKICCPLGRLSRQRVLLRSCQT